MDFQITSSELPFYSYHYNLESTPSAVDRLELIIRVDEKILLEVETSGEIGGWELTGTSRSLESGNRSLTCSFDLDEVLVPSSLPAFIACMLYEVGICSEFLEDLELRITSFIRSKMQEQTSGDVRRGLTVRTSIEERWTFRVMDDEELDGASGSPSMAPGSTLVKREIYARMDSEDSCPICLSEFSVGEEIGRTPCGHLFHPECVGRWLNRSIYCPLCRFQIAS